MSCKPGNRSSIPGTPVQRQKESTNITELSSDIHIGTMVCVTPHPTPIINLKKHSQALETQVSQLLELNINLLWMLCVHLPPIYRLPFFYLFKVLSKNFFHFFPTLFNEINAQALVFIERNTWVLYISLELDLVQKKLY